MIAPGRAARRQRRSPQHHRPCRPLLLLLLLCCSTLLPAPAPALAAPQLWLPTPEGERWEIIQGYGCGTHRDHDYHALDLVSAEGPTQGAPIRAAADGTVWAWTASSGTIMLAHEGDFKTEYTHLASRAVGPGERVRRGDVIGTAGDVGAEGTPPHLHFVLYHGGGSHSMGRSLPLSFADGYQLPETEGCNQHGGAILVARGEPDTTPPEISFASELRAGDWANSDRRIDFQIADDRGVAGFSQAWDRDPGGEAPMFAGTGEGYVQLEWAGAGEHTLYVRAWDLSGNQTLAALGPIGYDAAAPEAVGAADLAQGERQTMLRWDEPEDAGGAGIAGYHIYVGAEAEGTDDWFSEHAELPLAPDATTPFVRARALDRAGNAGPWATIFQQP